MIVDSDLVTTRIYADVLFGYRPEFPAWIQEENRFDLHLLFDVDTPWVADVQRETGHMRSRMFDRFKTELDGRNLPYRVIRGSWEEREDACMEAIEARWPGMALGGVREATSRPFRHSL